MKSIRLAAGLPRIAKQFRRAESGLSTVEFALVVPILLLVLAGVVDLGGALKTKFDLNSAVTAGANYALVNAANIKSSTSSQLAGQIAAIAKGSLSGGSGEVHVTINNGAAVTFVAGETTSGGDASNADKCYCPARSGSNISFGTSVTCGTACASGGGTAGKFVTIRASKPYNPLFGGLGIVQDGNISVQAVVQPQ